MLGFVKLPFSPEGLVRSRQTCTRLLHGRLGHTSAVSVSVAPSARARWDFFFVCDQGHCGWAARQPLCTSISQCKKSALSTFRSCFSCAWPDPVFFPFCPPFGVSAVLCVAQAHTWLHLVSVMCCDANECHRLLKSCFFVSVQRVCAKHI
jgi:hypothetical protein